ncbi:DUF6879 family protein [Nonomuraea sp. CA-143628]|uniref:DUF6879 family protein n=1 Tax=Nonomuraea sp. CA-143628 TaxID=3239997 RepID=UPI003D8ED9EA
MRLEGDAWREFFDGFQTSAWRLETRAVYSMPGEQEEFTSFLTTGRLDIPDDDAWLTRVRDFRASGRTIGRVHALTRPLSDYLRYEFAVYSHTSRVGEDIRIADLTDTPNPGIPNFDFWMFDEQHVVLMEYDLDGVQVGRELLDRPDIARFIGYRDIAMGHSVPFHEYQAGLRSGVRAE